VAILLSCDDDDADGDDDDIREDFCFTVELLLTCRQLSLRRQIGVQSKVYQWLVILDVARKTFH